MMDLLCITTGNIFRLPDADALRFYRNDPKTFKILDAGFQEAKEVVNVDEKTVAELIMPKEEKIEEVKEEAKPKKETKPLEDYSFAELRAFAQSLGLSGKGTKQAIYERIKEELAKENE